MQPGINCKTTTKTKSGKRAIPLDDRLTEFLKPISAEGYILGGDNPITNMVFHRLYDSIEKQIDLYNATSHKTTAQLFFS